MAEMITLFSILSAVTISSRGITLTSSFLTRSGSTSTMVSISSLFLGAMSMHTVGMRRMRAMETTMFMVLKRV